MPEVISFFGLEVKLSKIIKKTLHRAILRSGKDMDFH